MSAKMSASTSADMLVGSASLPLLNFQKYDLHVNRFQMLHDNFAIKFDRLYIHVTQTPMLKVQNQLVCFCQVVNNVFKNR